MPRLTVRILVTDGLHYCCPWFFFTRFRDTQMIAARLGVTDRAVRLAKERVDEGEWKCEKRPGCLHERFTMKGEPRYCREVV